MIVLDTDVLSLIQRADSHHGMRVTARIAQLPDTERVATTIVTNHEQTQGWLAYLAKARSTSQQVYAYRLLERHVADYRQIDIVSYDQAAADTFDRLRPSCPRLGTMDLRIAAIAVSHHALPLSRNIAHFAVVPELRVEDWTKV